jgi:hypothetical protein
MQGYDVTFLLNRYLKGQVFPETHMIKIEKGEEGLLLDIISVYLLSLASIKTFSLLLPMMNWPPSARCKTDCQRKSFKEITMQNSRQIYVYLIVRIFKSLSLWAF